MIDVENDVFDYVYPYVSDILPEGCFSSVFVPQPPAFPYATLMETYNVTDTGRRTTRRLEDFAALTYEVNVYALNKPKCREIMDAIDRGMTTLGFTRISCMFIPNLEDMTLFRMTARYEAIADNDKTIYRRG